MTRRLSVLLHTIMAPEGRHFLSWRDRGVPPCSWRWTTLVGAICTTPITSSTTSSSASVSALPIPRVGLRWLPWTGNVQIKATSFIWWSRTRRRCLVDREARRFKQSLHLSITGEILEVAWDRCFWIGSQQHRALSHPLANMQEHHVTHDCHLPSITHPIHESHEFGGQ